LALRSAQAKFAMALLIGREVMFLMMVSISQKEQQMILDIKQPRLHIKDDTIWQLLQHYTSKRA